MFCPFFSMAGICLLSCCVNKMRKRITILLGVLGGVFIVLFMVLNYYIQIKTIQHNTIFSSQILFNQIKNVIFQNEKDIQQIIEEYGKDCLARAQAVAYILQQNTSALTDAHAMQKIASLLEVDEIHIFDKTGTIYAGSEPKYFGYTMDSGEQMRFFAQMLNDTSLILCQPIAPNTAEGKYMQYAAVWMEDGSAIVQIGMEPHRVLEKIKRNDLSFIFLLLAVDKGTALFAVDPETCKIVGSSKEYMLGKDIRDYGINTADLENSEQIFHYDIQGHSVFCIFEKTDTLILGRFLSEQKIYDGIRRRNINLLGGMLVLTLSCVCFVFYYLNKYVIRPIKTINTKLGKIAEGDFALKIEETSSPEFSDLSNHIDDMVKNIVELTDTVSNLVETSNLDIGIYEHHGGMDSVRITSRVPEILHLSAEEVEALCSNARQFRAWMDRLLQKPFNGENHIYILDQGTREYYIKVVQVERKDGVFGIIAEYTEDILEKHALQKEVRQDLLTGLYNRRALHSELDRLFEDPALIKNGAIVIIDADDLKKANDIYGHEKGDHYLCAVADTLTSLHVPEQITARIGGDEFAIYFGGLQTQEEVEICIGRLRGLRDHSVVCIDGIEFLIRYSFGAGYFPVDGTDWHELMRLADKRMYADKLQRKKDMPR